MADRFAPKEALDYLRRKRLHPAFSYRDVWNAEHAHAFTVAKAMQMDVLGDIHAAVTDAIRDGQTFRDFQKRLAPILQAKGWWGKKTMIDPATGEVKTVQLGSRRRLETIYRTNLSSAYAHGQWQRGQASSAHTHILYLNGPSANHREQHQAWHGTLLPKDDPFWNTHFPPNGWGCKCYTRFVTRRTARQLEREGVVNPPRVDGSGGGTTPVTTTRPDIRYRTYHNRRRGTAERLPVGIDPGFAWNPGSGRAGTVQKAFREKTQRFTKAMHPSAPQGTPISGALNVRMRGAVAKATKRALEAIDRVHGDGPLPRLDVVQLQSKQYLGLFQYYPGGKANDIRILAKGPYPELTVCHEVGHFLDFSGMPGGGFTSENGKLEEMRDIIARIRAMETFHEITRREGYYYQQYLQDPTELWARVYAQYIATKSGDEVMLRQLDAVLASPDESLRLTQWPHAEFLPIAQSVDILFERLQWRSRNTSTPTTADDR